MNKAEFIDQVATRTGGDKKAASAAVDSFIQTVYVNVSKGERVAITGFGIFEKRDRAARTARNPATGASVKVKKTSVPAFRPGAEFKAITSGAKKLPKTTAVKAPAKSAATKSTATKTAAKSIATKSSAAKSTGTKSTASKSAAAKSLAGNATSAAAKSTAAKTLGAQTAAKSTATKSTATKSSAAKPAPAKATKSARKATKRAR